MLNMLVGILVEAGRKRRDVAGVDTKPQDAAAAEALAAVIAGTSEPQFAICPHLLGSELPQGTVILATGDSRSAFGAVSKHSQNHELRDCTDCRPGGPLHSGPLLLTAGRQFAWARCTSGPRACQRKRRSKKSKRVPTSRSGNSC